MSIFIGIDFSINSPAVCINTNDDHLYFYNIFRSGKLTKKEKLAVDLLHICPNVDIILNDSIQESKNYIERENNNLSEANFLTSNIMEIINKYTDNINKNDIHIVIEGFSYSSTGNRTAELGGYQYILRYKLNKEGYNFYICSPKTIKAIAGNGNYDKEHIISSFLNIYSNTNNDLSNFLINNKEILYINNKYWVKPIDDIIDAYWAMETAKKISLNFSK